MRRSFQPIRSPLGPFVLTAAIAVAQFAPSDGRGSAVQGRERPAEVAHMVGTLPEGAPMQVAAT